jgi:nitroreductase
MMNVVEAIEMRRSVKRFTDRPVGREEIERLLDLAVQAPNHRMTEPWGFVVLGPESRRAFGEVLGGRKARKVADAEAAEAVRAKVVREQEALPAMLMVTMKEAEDPEVRQEDYAATFMAVQNIMLGAVSMGLGAHLKTGAVMDDPGTRAAVGVDDDQRIIAMLNIGEPAELPSVKPRVAAAHRTHWLP